MYNNRQSRSHPLTQQVPLTVSPFVILPTPPTLSYNYKPMPSALPPSQTGIGAAAADFSSATSDQQQQQQQQMLTTQPSSTAGGGGPTRGSAAAGENGGGGGNSNINRPRYVVSPSGQAAHPSDIMASCRQLQEHLARMQADADRDLRAFEDSIRQRDLAEKRRVAPGWLDTEERLLLPQQQLLLQQQQQQQHHQQQGRFGGGMDAAGGGGGGVPTPPEMTGGATMMIEMPADDAVSEMADEGAELDRAFGGLNVGR